MSDYLGNWKAQLDATITNVGTIDFHVTQLTFGEIFQVVANIISVGIIVYFYALITQLSSGHDEMQILMT